LIFKTLIIMTTTTTMRVIFLAMALLRAGKTAAQDPADSPAGTLMDSFFNSF
jgi:hypothetical protein